jgi:UDP-N-acetylmuramate--alanine ligase
MSRIKRHPDSRPQKSVHLVGALGKGQMALAQLLHDRGWKVTGSDRKATGKMASEEISIRAGHDATFLPGGAECVIISAAIPDDNVEVVEARRQGIPVMERSQFLHEFLRTEHLVSVVGSQGKTTTTALLAEVFRMGGLNPGALVGAAIPSWNGRSSLPGNSIFFAETCEYSKQLMDFRPSEVVLTHIDASFHPETFESASDTIKTFVDFVSLLPSDGVLYYNGDCDLQKEIASSFDGSTVSVGTGEGCDVRGFDIVRKRFGSYFRIESEGEELRQTFFTPLPGDWNVKNAINVVAFALHHGVSPDVIQEALAGFSGISRRFEVLFDDPDGATVVDHLTFQPPAVCDLIAEARHRYSDKRCVVIFNSYDVVVLEEQGDCYARAFRGADQVIMRPVQPAFQQSIERADRYDLPGLAEEIRKHSETVVDLTSASESDTIDAAMEVLEEFPKSVFVVIGPPGRTLSEKLASVFAK